MYGEPHLNEANMVKYAWTDDFFQTFQHVVYRNIELAPVMMRAFHKWIRPEVEKRKADKEWVKMKQQQSGLTEYREVQVRLNRPVQMARDLSRYRHRQTLLLPGALYPFAVRYLTGLRVIFLLNGPHDRKMVAGWRKHRGFDVFDFKKALKKTRVPPQTKRKLMNRLRQQFAQIAGHELFSKPGFKKWMRVRTKKAAQQVKVLDQLLKKHPIRAIIHYNELDPPGNILTMLARKYGLPFYFVQMHLLSDGSVTPARASRYLVWGNRYKRWFEQKGVDPRTVLATGSLAFEPLARIKSGPPLTIRSKLGVPDHHKLILWTTQSFDEAINRKLLSWFHTAVALLPVTVVIRPHPSDRLDYAGLIRRSNVVLCPEHIGLHEMLSASDVVATVSSTTAFEAALIGKGLIVLQPPMPYHYYKNYNTFHRHLAVAKAGPVVSKPGELYTVLKQLVRSPHMKEKLEQMSAQFIRSTLHMHGSPAARIAKIIKDEVFSSTRRINRSDRSHKRRRLRR